MNVSEHNETETGRAVYHQRSVSGASPLVLHRLALVIGSVAARNIFVWWIYHQTVIVRKLS